MQIGFSIPHSKQPKSTRVSHMQSEIQSIINSTDTVDLCLYHPSIHTSWRIKFILIPAQCFSILDHPRAKAKPCSDFYDGQVYEMERDISCINMIY